MNNLTEDEYLTGEILRHKVKIPNEKLYWKGILVYPITEQEKNTFKKSKVQVK
jgi:hypothetical protein